MTKEILTSIVTCTRLRTSWLKRAMDGFFNLAKYPDKIEYLISVDDDDEETINFAKTDDIFKKYKNIKVFISPRIGREHLWLIFRDFFKMARGDIIIPYADDNLVFLPEWDEFFLQYKDEVALIGWRARLVITKKAIEEDECIRNFGWKFNGGDTHLFKYACSKGIYKAIDKWSAKSVPNDIVQKEGYWPGGWSLKDLSILDNLELKELEIER